MKRIALLVVILAASFVQAQTAHDYFAELAKNGGVSPHVPMDQYVCFPDNDKGNFEIVGRADFMLAGGVSMPKGTNADKRAFINSIFVERYSFGVPSPANMYEPVGKLSTAPFNEKKELAESLDRHAGEYDIEFMKPIHGRMVYSIDWDTGRYVLKVYDLGSNKNVSAFSGTGKCQHIWNEKDEVVAK